jgi:hypothetical protein
LARDRQGRDAPASYLPYKKARSFARNLQLKSLTEWQNYCKFGKLTADIPANPHHVYANDGWAGYGDWLGTGRIAAHLREYRPFKKARALARRRGLKSQADWRNYCQSENKPDDIPGKPDRTYANAGWIGWGDWLGTGRVAPGQHRSFGEARAFVRKLKLKSFNGWRKYCKSGKKPDDIPVAPDSVYENVGWSGMGDWLGTGRVATHLRQYLPYKKARAFVRARRLKTETEWREYSVSGKKPTDIPANPHHVYANDGWAGYGDWLGTGRKRRGIPWRSFKQTRAYVRELKLKSSNEWYAYCKSGKKPNEIPSNPQQAYAQSGWSGMGDWLGYARKR